MKFFATLTAISALASSALAQLTINSPAAIIQCQPVQLTFSGGEAPYYLAVIPGGQVSAAPLRDFGQVSSSPYTWNANLQAGTSITLRLSDSAGLFAYSSPITIQAGSSDSCLSQTAITQSGASTVASTPSSSGAASAATTTGGLSSTVTGTVTSAASVTTTFSSSAMSSSTNVVSSATGAVSSRVSSASNALSSALSSVQSQVASATSTGAASPTGIAGAGAVFVGALGAMAALL